MYILGGASRTGKGLLAQMLMAQLNVPYFSIDPIKMTLARAVPSYPLNTHGSSIEVCEDLWPFVSTLIQNLIETNMTYLVEGEILPKQVAYLRAETSVAIQACFVGYRHLSVADKMAQVRRHSGHPNDWTAELTDAELSSLICEGVEYSQYLYDQCQTYGLRYVDFSENFEQAKAEVSEFFSRASQP